MSNEENFFTISHFLIYVLQNSTEKIWQGWVKKWEQAHLIINRIMLSLTVKYKLRNVYERETPHMIWQTLKKVSHTKKVSGTHFSTPLITTISDQHSSFNYISVSTPHLCLSYVCYAIYPITNLYLHLILSSLCFTDIDLRST